MVSVSQLHADPAVRSRPYHWQFCLLAGKDATAEFDMIHHAPAVIGKIGDGGEDDDDDDEEDDSSEGGYAVEEVAKHNKKGELAILTFAGKDAATEFDMIYPPVVVEKYAPDAIIDWCCRQWKGQGSREVGLAGCHRQGRSGCEFGGLGRLEDGFFRRHARSPLGERLIVRQRLLLFNSRHHLWGSVPRFFLILNIIYDSCAIILSAKNFKMIERGLHEVQFSCSF